MTRTIIRLLLAGICASPAAGLAQSSGSGTTAAEDSYPPIPSIPAIGVRNTRYADVPASAQGPAVDPAKGYRLQDLGQGLYMITNNAYQSMFLVYDRGVVVIDAPPDYSAKIPQAIAEVTRNPITHVVYSHSHTDHIGGTRSLGMLCRNSSPRSTGWTSISFMSVRNIPMRCRSSSRTGGPARSSSC